METTVITELHVPRGIKLLAGLMMSAVAGLHLAEAPALLQRELYLPLVLFLLGAVLALLAVFGITQDRWGAGWVMGVLTCAALMLVYLVDKGDYLGTFTAWVSSDGKARGAFWIELAFILLWLLGPSRVQSWYNYALIVPSPRRDQLSLRNK